MNEVMRQFVCGVGAIILAPSGQLPFKGLRITLPPENATQAIGFDFSRVAKDLRRSIEKVEHAKQLELGV